MIQSVRQQWPVSINAAKIHVLRRIHVLATQNAVCATHVQYALAPRAGVVIHKYNATDVSIKLK